MDLAEIAFELPHHAQQAPKGLALLGATREFVEKALALDELLVANVDGHEDQGPLMTAQVALHRHAENACAGRQHAPAAAACALDEILDGESTGDHQVQVLVETSSVEGLVLESAAQEEGTAPPQQGADDREVEIGPGGDMGRRQAAIEDDVGEQQVIDVAAVAGNVDDALAGGDAQYRREVMYHDAVIEAGPQPSEKKLEGPHHAVGVVGGDLQGE